MRARLPGAVSNDPITSPYEDRCLRADLYSIVMIGTYPTIRCLSGAEDIYSYPPMNEPRISIG